MFKRHSLDHQNMLMTSCCSQGPFSMLQIKKGKWQSLSSKMSANETHVKRVQCATGGETANIPGLPLHPWKWLSGTSLVAQWIRIRLPMQGTWVQSLVREDPTCHGATKPVHHNYWACTLEPMCHNYWARVSQLLKPTHRDPVLRNKRSHHKEKPAHRNEE